MGYWHPRRRGHVLLQDLDIRSCHRADYMSRVSLSRSTRKGVIVLAQASIVVMC